MKLTEMQAKFVLSGIEQLLEQAPFVILWADEETNRVHRMSNMSMEQVIAMLEGAAKQEREKRYE